MQIVLLWKGVTACYTLNSQIYSDLLGSWNMLVKSVLKQQLWKNNRAASLIQLSDTSNSLLTHPVTLENSTENAVTPLVCMCVLFFNPTVWDYITSNRQEQIRGPVI